LNIGSYQDDIPATINLNARDIPNTQILVAGSTGSGKSNLLAVLMREMRSLTVETAYPFNFYSLIIRVSSQTLQTARGSVILK
jgi:DNA helicase HerA-like ATPase